MKQALLTSFLVLTSLSASAVSLKSFSYCELTVSRPAWTTTVTLDCDGSRISQQSYFSDLGGPKVRQIVTSHISSLSSSGFFEINRKGTFTGYKLSFKKVQVQNQTPDAPENAEEAQ